MKYLLTLALACGVLFTASTLEARHHRHSSFSLSFGSAFAPVPVCQPCYVNPYYAAPAPCYVYAPQPCYVYPAPRPIVQPVPVVGHTTTFSWYNCR